ncbi:aminotransferase [Rhodoferax lacus]|uniref:histidinol-phosphate transaminase n=1 Tax=Rhodoferax lacus TaxID=2184758 RepID=A0A3E1RG35_9BURK|nr:aminotransferase class I/II-fold pyridoxal phosphate-dependent enzyme [Rhodoferax lacus]RFO97570.1 aminotransferase [Rhodoferax lacus]
MTSAPRIHGGPDALGVPLYDFSTNSNSCGPCPQAMAAVQAANATRYPDASYTAVREQLAAFHGVDSWRVVLAGSASEFIFRMTAWTVQQGGRSVWLPQHAYGDYAHAARSWGLQVASTPETADLVWVCDPSSPLGQTFDAWPLHKGQRVCDCAYAPLRLEGTSRATASQQDCLWQMFSPNKALGLTGVRAAYAIAPLNGQQAAQQLEALAPSWPVGAHGVAMLLAWVEADTQAWLQQSLQTLRAWKLRQVGLLQAMHWHVEPSVTPFFCARPALEIDAPTLCAELRAQGIKLRDTTSFDLPGYLRLGVLPPHAQDALLAALHRPPMAGVRHA